MALRPLQLGWLRVCYYCCNGLLRVRVRSYLPPQCSRPRRLPTSCARWCASLRSECG